MLARGDACIIPGFFLITGNRGLKDAEKENAGKAVRPVQPHPAAGKVQSEQTLGFPAVQGCLVHRMRKRVLQRRRNSQAVLFREQQEI